MSKGIVIVNTRKVSVNLTSYDEKMLKWLAFLGLPQSDILVSVEERYKVFKNVEDVLNSVDTEKLKHATYISKFLAAVSAGLFDAALNYLWNETINQLRMRISQYDVQYFYDIAVSSNDKRNKLTTEADLNKIDDSELIQGAKKIGLISDVGYRLLDNIKFMRNWASAAHPNQVQLTGLQLIDWLETCLKEVINLPMSNITIEIKKLLQNIKNNVLSELESRTICQFFSELTADKARDLCNGFFGMYCRSDTSNDTKRNIKLLLPDLWHLMDEDIKWNFGIKYSQFQINNDQLKARMAREFLQIVDGETYLPESIKVVELENELENLHMAHKTMNNFYTEPTYAKQIKRLVWEKPIPNQITKMYVMIIVSVYLTNGYGITWGSEDIYNELIDNFTQVQFLLAVTSFTSDEISSKLQFDLCQKQYLKLIRKAKDNVTSPQLLDLIYSIETFQKPLWSLKEDPHIIQQINQLKSIIKYY